MNLEVFQHGGMALADAVRKAYSQGQIDYSLAPLVAVNERGEPVGRIKDGDAVVFCCRRGEREVELTEAFTEPGFLHFTRPPLDHLIFVILTLYHEKFTSLPVAFAPTGIINTLGEVVARAGKLQMRIAESEKFAHVTYYFNGGSHHKFPGETDVCIPSPKGIPVDQKPELSLPQVADAVVKGINTGADFIVVNFANGDVIGHTASTPAKIHCAEIIDRSLHRVALEALAADYVVVLTADHGNLEVLTTEDGTPHVSHTTNPVPFLVLDLHSDQPVHPKSGQLADIGPTILQIMGLKAPQEFTGVDLLPDVHWEPDRKVLLLILDGWGLGQENENNPIHLAATPYWDKLNRKFHRSELSASGQAVGLNPNKAGNSEAGHLNIGAGRVVPQDDVRLDKALNDGSFYTNEVILNAIHSARQRQTDFHLVGLLSEKSSHGSVEYILAGLRMARAAGLENAYVHVIFDGRSTEPGSAPAWLEQLERRIDEIGIGRIVSGVGRGIALDRDGNYAKIQQAFDALVQGQGAPYRI